MDVVYTQRLEEGDTSTTNDDLSMEGDSSSTNDSEDEPTANDDLTVEERSGKRKRDSSEDEPAAKQVQEDLEMRSYIC